MRYPSEERSEGYNCKKDDDRAALSKKIENQSFRSKTDGLPLVEISVTSKRSLDPLGSCYKLHLITKRHPLDEYRHDFLPAILCHTRFLTAVTS